MRILFEQEKQKPRIEDREILRKIYSRIFSSNDGKIIIEDLANVSGMYRSNFIQNNNDYTCFLEGQRALFLYICSNLENEIENIEGKE
jgi:hypothetical protein